MAILLNVPSSPLSYALVRANVLAKLFLHLIIRAHIRLRYSRPVFEKVAQMPSRNSPESL